MKRSNKIWFLIILMAVPAGCNIFEESDSLPVLSVLVTPTTAGSVLTAGMGDESGDVQLTAIPNTNWQFSHWSGDVDSNENPLLFNLNENKEVFANFVISGSESGIALIITDGQFLSNLRFGKVAGATDGFDSGMDMEAPPPPPSGVLYAWFEGGDRRLLRDFRNPFNTIVEWELHITPGNTSTINIAWEAEDGQDEVFMLYDDLGAEIAVLEGTSNIEIQIPDKTILFIRK